MPRALYPHRIWLYLILAAAMLAAPLLQYTDSGERLGALAIGTAVLTLIAYGEIFASVRRGTRILRAMHGQRDLMFLASVSPLSARRDIRRDLWQNGGWVALGALWVGRFALAFALAQYLQVSNLYWPYNWPHEMLARPISSALGSVNYPSSNYVYLPDGTWQVIWYQPVWWQRFTAVVLLLVVLLAEVRFMQALGMAVFLRQRRMQRWAVPSGFAARVIIFGAALLAIQSVSLIPHEDNNGQWGQRSDLACLERSRYINIPRFSSLDPQAKIGCEDTLFTMQGARVLETAKLAFAGLFEGGVLLSATAMRANLSVTHTGTGFDYEVAIEYTGHSTTYPYFYEFHWVERVSPLWVILRMALGIAATVAILLPLSQVVFWLTLRRYHAVPS